LINTESIKVLYKFLMALLAFLGYFYLFDFIKCLIHEHRASNGGVLVHQEDLHGIVSVNIILQECFEDTKRESVPLCSLDESLDGFKYCLELIIVL